MTAYLWPRGSVYIHYAGPMPRLTAHVAEPGVAPREGRLALSPDLVSGLGG